VSVVQQIPNTRLTGAQTFNFTATDQPWSNATVVINRAVLPGGLNSLTATDGLAVDIDWSPDGGTTWRNVGGGVFPGGTVVVKGVTPTEDEISIGIGEPFPSGAGFRVRTDVTGRAVRIAGSITYE
jgi:hypothetical protein